MKIQVDVRLDPVAQAALPLVELGTAPTNAEAVLVHVERLADAVLDRYGHELGQSRPPIGRAEAVGKGSVHHALESAAVPASRRRRDGVGEARRTAPGPDDCRSEYSACSLSSRWQPRRQRRH